SPTDEMTAKAARLILVVEDNAADIFLIREAITASGINAGVHCLRDGEQAIRFLDDADRDVSAPCPNLVILDINLPKRHGTEVLRHLRQSSRCGNTPVIVVSTSDSARDREESMKRGATGYFRKPSEFDEFLKLGDVIRELFPNSQG